VSVSSLTIRRFNPKVDGVASIVELAKARDWACVPGRDMQLDCGDGTGIATVSYVRLQPVTPGALGVQPPRVLVFTKTEPGELLEAARLAGWLPYPPAVEER
jgi:hypothetical protein